MIQSIEYLTSQICNFRFLADQDELDAERASEWVGDNMSDVDNPIRNDNDADINGVELIESTPNENVGTC